MATPLIHGHFVSGSAIILAAGDALSHIRHEDRLTWADLGYVLGKSEDQAAKYADGTAEMGIVACVRARQVWGERFVGRVHALTDRVAPHADPQAAQSCILRAALALSTALEDGKLTNQEIAANRQTLERTKDAVESLLARLGPKAGAA